MKLSPDDSPSTCSTRNETRLGTADELRLHCHYFGFRFMNPLNTPLYYQKIPLDDSLVRPNMSVDISLVLLNEAAQRYTILRRPAGAPYRCTKQLVVLLDWQGSIQSFASS